MLVCIYVCVCYGQNDPLVILTEPKKEKYVNLFDNPFMVFHSHSTFQKHICLGLSIFGELIKDKC